jgi:transglutaminase-like putative cysteine protease/predicted glutamine amidotransferase
MPNLFAMSFEGDLAPSFDLRCLSGGGKLPDGWGIGFYPGGEPSASVLKEPAPPPGSIRSQLVRSWEHLESSVFLLHIRTATWGRPTDANTQPFCRSRAGRDWLMAHSGSLRERLPHRHDARYEPIGSTDTESVFCELLSRVAERGWRSLGDADLPELQRWFDELNSRGSLTVILTDGRDLCVYADRDGAGGLHLCELYPPENEQDFGDDDLVVSLSRRGVKSRKGVVLSSTRLSPPANPAASMPWRQLAPGSLVIVRQGAIRAEMPPLARPETPPPASVENAPAGRRSPLRRDRASWRQAETRRLSIVHRTAYRYEVPVERSIHRLKLIPTHDVWQTLLHSDVRLSVNGQRREHEDVFGNRVIGVSLETPYTELVIEARSEVEVRDVDPGSLRLPRARSSIPLVWMPWQRLMLQPYLVPPELSESELLELVEYAMSFVERNDFDLLDTLLDLNATIFEEYTYAPGATDLATTAFDVYANRRGVCQDFTNLFICLARLLGVPARYVCGYVYAGPKHPNRQMSEASHAWVQVYLPDIGWRGFDPTNGILTQTDHVRVAVGRIYRDATPTSGTLFVGGGPEVMEVDVRVERLE